MAQHFLDRIDDPARRFTDLAAQIAKIGKGTQFSARPQKMSGSDLLGQKTESMAHHYSRNAILADSNRATMDTLDFETERRTKTVKPFPKTVKPE